jgi:hypothetical protein
VLGLLLAGLAAYDYTRTTRFLSHAEETTSTVVEMVERTSITTDAEGRSHESRLWHPVVRFTVDDQTVEFVAKAGSPQPAYHAGDSVTVAYDPADLRDAKIVSFAQLYRGPLLLGLLGIAFFGGGAIARIVGWRRQRRAY